MSYAAIMINAVKVNFWRLLSDDPEGYDSWCVVAGNVHC